MEAESIGALVGLDGFRLIGAVEVEGELWQLVETTTAVVGCQGCGTRARAKDRRTVRLRDLSVAGRPVVVGWRMRVWRCPDPDCETRTWTERRDDVARPRRSTTERARADVCRQVGRDGRSVTAVAGDYGVSWATAWEAVVDHTAGLLDDPDRVGDCEAVGLDETSFRRGNHLRGASFVTDVVDVERGVLLDVFGVRDAAHLRRWTAEADQAWLAGVVVVSVDPHEGYRHAIASVDEAGRPSPWAHVDLVADPFTSCGWPTTTSPAVASASSRPPWAIGAGRAIPSMASAVTSPMSPEGHTRRPSPMQPWHGSFRMEPGLEPARLRPAPRCAAPINVHTTRNGHGLQAPNRRYSGCSLRPEGARQQQTAARHQRAWQTDTTERGGAQERSFGRHPATIPRASRVRRLPLSVALCRPVPFSCSDQDICGRASIERIHLNRLRPTEKREVTGSTPVPTTAKVLVRRGAA